MASLVAMRHPDRFCALAMHSGPILGKAHSIATGLETMQADNDPEAEELIELLTEYTPQHFNLPTMIIHGEQDKVVNSSNAHQLATQFLHLNNVPTDSVPVVSHRYAQTSREYTHKTYKYKRQSVVELVEVKHLDHSWGGGDDSLAYNSRKGPSSSKLIWNFFKRCARQYDLRQIKQASLPLGDE